MAKFFRIGYYSGLVFHWDLYCSCTVLTLDCVRYLMYIIALIAVNPNNFYTGMRSNGYVKSLQYILNYRV